MLHLHVCLRIRIRSVLHKILTIPFIAFLSVIWLLYEYIDWPNVWNASSTIVGRWNNILMFGAEFTMGNRCCWILAQKIETMEFDNHRILIILISSVLVVSCMCGIVYHYPIYRDRPIIGRSNLLYACTNHSFALLRMSFGMIYNHPKLVSDGTSFV